MIEKTTRDWQKLARAMDVTLDAERASEIKASVMYRQRRSRRNARAVMSGTLAATIGLMLWVVIRTDPRISEPRLPVNHGVVSQTAREIFEGSKGGRNADKNLSATQQHASPLVVPLTPGTRYSVEEGVDSSTYFLATGSIRFRTGRDSPKKILVRVGDLLLEDIGTVFTVETINETQAYIYVSEGTVLATWSSGNREIHQGEGGLFPPNQQKHTSPVVSKPGAGYSVSVVEDWRVPARRGECEEAVQLIDENNNSVRNRVEDLMLAADVMRLCGRAKRATAYLQAVLDGFSDDSRAPLAAFTLGRVYLDELRLPQRAADAFSRAARDTSPLAEEASAREVESWYRAGNTAAARASALRYLDRYPKGHAIDKVRAFGGIGVLEE